MNCSLAINLAKDPLVRAEPLLAYVDKWGEFVNLPVDKVQRDAMQKHERTGRPLGRMNLLFSWKPILAGC